MLRKSNDCKEHVPSLEVRDPCGRMSQQANGAAAVAENEGKRQRCLSRKALQNEIEGKRKQLDNDALLLQNAFDKALNTDEHGEEDLPFLQNATERYKETLLQLTELYQQDKWDDYKEEAHLTREYSRLERARKTIAQRTAGSQASERASQITRRSSHTSTTRSSTSSSSSARRKAITELAAIKKQAEFDKRIAEKERARKLQEAEDRRKKEEQQAQHELDIALLEADRAQAVADAKLEAIERCMEEEREQDLESREGSMKELELITKHPRKNVQDRVKDWVDTHPNELPISTPEHLHERQPIASSTPARQQEWTMLETFTATNQRLVSGLSKQSLPKCHPDIFEGEVTLFHPWKRAFKAMIDEADVTPAQEMNYLRNFTGGEVQNVVDNYRKRHHADLSVVLEELWRELERRFGNTAAITNALLERLTEKAAFAEKDLKGLQTFADLCGDVSSQLSYLPGLSCLNYPNVIRPIVEKLPSFLRAKWEKEIVTHAVKNNDAYPGFDKFASMVQRQSATKNHPNVQASGVQTGKKAILEQPPRRVLKTTSEEQEPKRCQFHDRTGHSLSECKAFNEKTTEEKSEWILKERLCFRCFDAGHVAKDCNADVTCATCNSNRHPTLLHKEKPEQELKSACTSICRTGGTSCSKIVLVDVYLNNRPEELHRAYAIVDDQSNASMISPELADKLNVNSPPERYLLSTCSGEKMVNYGRRATGVTIAANKGTFELPTLIECSQIPGDKSEIPTREIANRFDHLKEIADELPPFNHHAKVHLLIGRDAPELLKVRAFKNGPRGAPWAQRLDLGWTISGQVCLNRIGKPFHVSTKCTSVSNNPNDMNSKMQVSPCPNHFTVKESLGGTTTKIIEGNVYHTTPLDNEVDMSVEDRKFLEIMENSIHKNNEGNWEMPLPFRSKDVKLPNNKTQAESRLAGLLKLLRRKPQMEKDYFEFMAKILKKGHAVPATTTQPESRDDNGDVWYLPHFGVYHPRKPTQIRVVFDSSAEFRGVSLNKELLTGPDLANTLFGVLLRFRHHETAAICDVEQMFHSFKVDPKHRSFLRFLWFKNNDPSEEIIEYHMTVHLFGNGPSPAIATFGLRKTALDGEEEYGKDTAKFIHRNFYVDDGLVSCTTPHEAINLVKNAQAVLATANIRLHKVISNSVEVMEALPADDRAKDVKDLDLRKDTLPSQRTLGVQWNLQEDKFTFKVSIPDKPFTRRGVLSVVNSIYDPIGLAVPVTLKGKLLLQKIVSMGKTLNNDRLGWDDPLPEDYRQQWQSWKDALPELEKSSLPRCLHPKKFGQIARAEVHAFSDASEDAIGVAVYLRVVNDHAKVHTTFLFGQSKVAPIKPTSIPRLELCGAVLATQAVRKVLAEIDMEIHEVTFYTDSKVVLGYIQNENRRFHTYVANRIQVIRSVSYPKQWKFVNTSTNPADLATRGTEAGKLGETAWLKGPEFLQQTSLTPAANDEVALAEHDPEVRTIASKSTSVTHLQSARFSRFSSWSSLRRAMAVLIAKAREIKKIRNESTDAGCKKDERVSLRQSVTELDKATTLLIKTMQEEEFSEELKSLSSTDQQTANREKVRNRKRSLKNSRLYELDPFIDEDGILRVGGRLRRSSLDFAEKHPAILPKDHHLSALLIRHYHQEVHHQGRQITHGAVRQAGYWVISGHSAVTKILKECIVCRRSRGTMLTQHMADLPEDRTEPSPPFTCVGIDVFGPWLISTRRLRGGAANSKRWGLVFTCLSSRAIHIELLESMDASSFICALRRFSAIRGPVSKIRCDRGTNFVGGKSELEQSLTEADHQKIQRYSSEHGCEWVFNPPHASHFGGVWERQIRTIRSVLDSMLTQIGSPQLTHELLATLMAEVAAIVNSRPLTTVPSDTEEAQPLSPSMLLTAKERPLNPPPGDFVPEDLYARRRWRRTQYLADQFWTRWRREYLQNLQRRPKWQDSRPNLVEGDLVLIKDEETRRYLWPLGKVTKAIQSADGKVRKAEVRKADRKTLLRPISQLVFLMSADKE